MDIKPRTKPLPRHVRARIAVAAQVELRTVTRFCEGQQVRAMGAERIEKAMRAEGIAVLAPAEGKDP